MVVSGESRFFDTFDFRAKGIDSWIGGNAVFVVGSGEPAKEQWNRDHVLHAMIAVGRIGERAFLVDDAQAGFVRANRDFFNVLGGFARLSSRWRIFIAASTAVCAWNSAG